MRATDSGNFYFIANPVGVTSMRDIVEALRDSLSDADIDFSDVELVIDHFKTRIKEVKGHV